MLVALLPVGLAAAQSAAEAAPAQATAPTAQQAVKPSRGDKVCQYEDVTGSRMKKRVCYTAEQWEVRERTAKELKREMDSKPIPRDGQSE